MNYNFVTVKKTPATTPLDPSRVTINPAHDDAGAEDEIPDLVLVVDDSIDNLTMISLDLQQNGYRVATATNGEEAVKVAAMINPITLTRTVTLRNLASGSITPRRCR